ncbi:hypothetical protein DFJ73DRAFT_369360 [Zopfochytrium polystomum]|nr:hypothetical protein DFJ73DRAFT_369360 [Zopfochytrium polystomum]
MGGSNFSSLARTARWRSIKERSVPLVRSSSLPSRYCDSFVTYIDLCFVVRFRAHYLSTINKRWLSYSLYTRQPHIFRPQNPDGSVFEKILVLDQCYDFVTLCEDRRLASRAAGLRRVVLILVSNRSKTHPVARLDVRCLQDCQWLRQEDLFADQAVPPDHQNRRAILVWTSKSSVARLTAPRGRPSSSPSPSRSSTSIGVPPGSPYPPLRSSPSLPPRRSSSACGSCTSMVPCTSTSTHSPTSSSSRGEVSGQCPEEECGRRLTWTGNCMGAI